MPETSWETFGTELNHNIQDPTALLPLNQSLNLFLKAPIQETGEISGILDFSVPLGTLFDPLELSYDILVNDTSVLGGTQILFKQTVLTSTDQNIVYTQTVKYVARATNLKCDCVNLFQVVLRNQSTPPVLQTANSIRINIFTLSVTGPSQEKKSGSSLQIFDHQKDSQSPAYVFSLPAGGTRSIYLPVDSCEKCSNILLDILLDVSSRNQRITSIGLDFELFRDNCSLTNGRRPWLATAPPSFLPLNAIFHVPFVLVDTEVKNGKHVYKLNLYNTAFSSIEDIVTPGPLVISLFNFVALVENKNENEIFSRQYYNAIVPVPIIPNTPTFRLDLKVACPQIHKIKLNAVLYFLVPSTEFGQDFTISFDLLRNNESIARYNGFQPYDFILDASLLTSNQLIQCPILFVDEPPFKQKEYIYSIEFVTLNINFTFINYYFSAILMNTHHDKL